MDATTGLLACGVGAVALFTAVWAIEGARRPGYRPTYHPISALSLGPRGWVQAASFVVTGVLFVAFAAGVHSAGAGVVVPILLGLSGLGLVGAGVFPMDAMRGYPPGAIDGDPEAHTAQHGWHDRASVVVFLAIPAAASVTALTSNGWWRWYSIAAAGAGLGLLGWFGSAYERDTLRAGVLQRLLVLNNWAWVALLALRLM